MKYNFFFLNMKIFYKIILCNRKFSIANNTLQSNNKFG